MRCLTLATLGLAVLLGTAFQPALAKRSDAAPTRRAETTSPLRGGHAARLAPGHVARHSAGASRTVAARPGGRGSVHGRASVADRGHVRRPMQGTRAVRGRYAMAREHHAALGSAACRRGRHCGGVRTSSWSAGLIPAANVQASECPDGTMATLARGHDNIVRCMPL